MPRLAALMKSIPPGYEVTIGGERAKQVQGFGDLAVVMGISVVAIFLALVLQFNHAIKPLLVFAAVPYGIVGALIALAIMGTPFGFMAFLGIASLIGVIVSHVIVLFDFIEEMHEKGAPLERALVDAGIMRLRHHSSPGPCLLQHFCSRPETRPMGRTIAKGVATGTTEAQ